MNARICSFREADLDSILEIAVAAWTPIYESYRQMLGASIFDTVFAGCEDRKKREVESACRGESGANVCVAEVDGKVAGFITYYLNRQAGIAEIGNNAVHPRNQGAGIGSLMYKHVLAEMKEAGMKCVKVSTGGDPAHASARRAYERNGFTRALPSVTYYREL